MPLQNARADRQGQSFLELEACRQRMAQLPNETEASDVISVPSSRLVTRQGVCLITKRHIDLCSETLVGSYYA